MEGIQEGELGLVLLNEIMIEIVKFYLKVERLEVDFLVKSHCLLGVQHGVKGLEVVIALWVAGVDAVLWSDL